MDELQQLDGELDVTDAAPAALDLAVGEARRASSASTAGLQVAHRPEVVGGEDPRPQLAPGGVVEGGAELGRRRRRRGP